MKLSYLLTGYLCYKFPSIGKYIWSCFTNYECKKYNKLYGIQDKKSDKAPAYIVFVDPRNITYCKKSFNFKQMGGKVKGGDWDRNLNVFENNGVFQCLQEHFINQIDWEDIDYVNECKRKVKNGETVWQNCNSIEDINNHCSDVDELYESIQEHGILEPIELLEQGKNARPYNIPKVNIARDGEFILNSDGTHRTALGKIIGIEKMPVWVVVRHKQWQAVRDRIRNGADVPEEYRKHPDLVDLT